MSAQHMAVARLLATGRSPSAAAVQLLPLEQLRCELRQLHIALARLPTSGGSPSGDAIPQQPLQLLGCFQRVITAHGGCKVAHCGPSEVAVPPQPGQLRCRRRLQHGAVGWFLAAPSSPSAAAEPRQPLRPLDAHSGGSCWRVHSKRPPCGRSCATTTTAAAGMLVEAAHGSCKVAHSTLLAMAAAAPHLAPEQLRCQQRHSRGICLQLWSPGQAASR